MRETWVQFLGREAPLEKEMATHSSIFAWRIPWTEEPGRLQFMGSQDLALSFFSFWRTSILDVVWWGQHTHTHTHTQNGSKESEKAPFRNWGSRGFPGGSEVKKKKKKNLPGNAETRVWCGFWKIPQAMEQLRLCSTTPEPVLRAQEPQLLSPCAATTEACAPQRAKPPQWEACKSQLESSPHSPQLEEVRAQQQGSSTAKNKYIIFSSIEVPNSTSRTRLMRQQVGAPWKSG